LSNSSDVDWLLLLLDFDCSYRLGSNSNSNWLWGSSDFVSCSSSKALQSLEISLLLLLNL